MRHLRHIRDLRLARAAVVAWALLAAATSNAWAQSAAETKFLADAADGQLHSIDLLDAAMLAGGMTEETELRSTKQLLATKWREVGQPLIERLPKQDRPRAIFSALHRVILTGKYRAECTEVQTTLAQGDFNCVTATILYLELCRQHGVQGSATAIPGHVYCRLDLGATYDVQTTCKEWFDVREGRVASSAAAKLARQVAEQPHQPRDLSDVQLLGKVYYNRGVSQLEARDYPGAIALLKTSLLLDPNDAPAKNNLLAAHNNWALALCDAKEFSPAAEKLSWAREIDANYAPLRTNDLYVHQKWVLNLCERGSYSAAIGLLDAGYERRPDAALYDGGRYALYGMWTRALLESNRVREALAVLEQARRKYGDHEELLDQEVQAFAAGIERLTVQGNASAAKAMLQIARARHPAAAALQAIDKL